MINLLYSIKSMGQRKPKEKPTSKKIIGIKKARIKRRRSQTQVY
jgi:hypothetical protein